MTGAAIPATTVVPFVLPHSEALTGALCAPSPVTVRSSTLAQVGARLMTSLTGTRRDLPGAGHHCRRVTGYAVGQAHLPARPADAASPFHWSPRTARRVVGLAAVAALRDGVAVTPATAVHVVIAHPDGAPGLPAGSCRDWLTSAPRAVRALVQGEAASWATDLWTALDWAGMPAETTVGPPDRWWYPHPSPRIAARGRAEVRTVTADGRPAALCVLTGDPHPGSGPELALVALVDGLTRGLDAVPARVVGWWPECGRTRIVTIDDVALWAAAGALAAAVQAELSEAGAP